MRKRLKLHKDAKNLPECLKILNWFTSPKAIQFYPPALLPNQNSILKEQFDLMAPIESAQISKDVETGRMRLAASDPLERLTDRCHVQNYSKELTQVIRKLMQVEPEKYSEMLINRLNRIVLSDFCVNEGIRVEYASELKDLISSQECNTSDYIKYNLDTEEIISKTILLDSFAPGPRDISTFLETASKSIKNTVI